ncbi:MAG TPA: DUF4900 domain-containing protein [Gelria sp.]|nr:DUF4900 domain-containing protein [Gelria sp.]
MRYIKSPITLFRNQHGAALPMVLILMILMIILSAAAYQVSRGNTGLVAIASSSEKALYAAEQGYNRTLWRLNNEKSDFLAAEDSNPDLIQYDDKDYNLYELEPGPNYRLNVLVPLIEIEGQTDKVEDNNRRIIRSTGWDSRYPERLRTIEVEVYKKTFTQFVMANDKEEDKSGTPINWLSGEVVYGPLHTNDTLYVRGNPVFHGPVTYVKGIDIQPAENMYNPAIFRKGNSQVAETLAFSSSLSNLKAHARIDGHYYNGRACIHLEDGGYNIRYYDRTTNTWHFNNAEYRFLPTNGKVMNWWDIPQSDLWWDWEIAAERAEDSKDVMFQRIFRNNDGSIDDNRTQNFRSFEDFAKTVDPLDLPPNGVIYVDGGTGGHDTTAKYNVELGNVFVSGKLSGRLTIAAANDIYITAHDPCDWSRPGLRSKPNWSQWWDNTPGVTYQDTDFVPVFENGEWTHNEVTGSGDDMLGLVAANYVNVLHYNWLSQHDKDVRYRGSIGSLFQYKDYCWTFMNIGVSVDNAPDNIYLHTAMYAQNESFGFEAYDADLIRGKDTARLVGSIAQKYRGPLGISGFILSGGYKKNYTHDPRFLYDSPPHFPDPVNSGWQSSRWSEIKDHIK